MRRIVFTVIEELIILLVTILNSESTIEGITPPNTALICGIAIAIPVFIINVIEACMDHRTNKGKTPLSFMPAKRWALRFALSVLVFLLSFIIVNHLSDKSMTIGFVIALSVLFASCHFVLSLLIDSFSRISDESLEELFPGILDDDNDE